MGSFGGFRIIENELVPEHLVVLTVGGKVVAIMRLADGATNPEKHADPDGAIVGPLTFRMLKASKK